MISAQMNKPGTLQWFAGHELSLFWRDFMRMMTAGKPGRERSILIVIFVAAAAMHLLAYGMIRPSLENGILPDKTSFVMITGTMFLIFSLMMSQALEMVTRVFYARSDLDLILSSPTSVKRLFAVRVGTIAISTTMLSLVLFAPAINVLAWYDGVQWLAGYPLLFCLGAIVTSLSLAITVALFKTFGAKRTRSMAQIVAAIVGASFIIGIQLAAISSIGSISRIEFFSSENVLAYAPHVESLLWVPARALMGDAAAIAAIVLASVATLAISIRVFSEKFGARVLAASNFTGAANVQKS
ncbi:MAG: permease, partial [Rhizobiaceae bacterium]|nr:permease [Rhizobiaceae bacterium]